MLRRACWIVVLLVLMPIAASADAVDMVQWARIEGSDTRDTFMGLWPRETDDAPYTVRDGDPETSWKLVNGRQTLTLDFAPLMDRAVEMESIEAEWNLAPSGRVNVYLYRYCGGELVDRGHWEDPHWPYVFDPAESGRCLVLDIEDSGHAELAELSVYAPPSDEVPEITYCEKIPVDSGLLLSALGDDSTSHIEIHYLEDASDKPGAESLVGRAVNPCVWEGPRPDLESGYAALVPVAADGTSGKPVVVEVEGRDAPTLKASGVVEGFYGTPWSHEERRLLILELARLDMGIYIYGPKDDPLHRDLWREPYHDAAVERFGELLRLGNLVGVTFSFGISPGQDMAMNDEDERQTLLQKLEPFVDEGFRHFTLLLDDIEWSLEVPVDAALGVQHAELANWLKTELGAMAGDEVDLWIVPTVYSSARRTSWPGGDGYLQAMRRLHSDIDIMWTGTDTFSPTLDAQDLFDVTTFCGRRPVIWDNEHATDGGDAFVGKVYMAPYEGRSADLVAAVKGIVANPMILGAANRLVLPTYGAYLADSYGYDPGAALEAAADLETIEEMDRRLAYQLTQVFVGSGARGLPGINLPIYPGMMATADAFESAMAGGDPTEIVHAGSDLLRVAAGMAIMQNDLHHSGLEPSLVDDMWVPCDRLTYEGRALLAALDWTASMLEDGIPDDGQLGLALYYLEEAFRVRYQLSLFRVNVLMAFLQKHRPGGQGFAAPVIYDAPPDGMTQERWEYRPSSGADVTVYGLPGAYVDNGQVIWLPQHPGTYDAIVVATADAGWAWKEFSVAVDVTEAEDDSPEEENEDEGWCG